MTDGIDMLLNGNIVGGILSPFTSLMGYWVYVIIFFLTDLMIYIRTQNASVAVVVMMLFGGAGKAYFPPEGQLVADLFIIVATTGIFWRLYKG